MCIRGAQKNYTDFFFFGETVERFNAFLIDIHAPNKFILSQIAKRLITTFRVGEQHDLSCKCVRGVFFYPPAFAFQPLN